jgi:hypothetical protein
MSSTEATTRRTPKGGAAPAAARAPAAGPLPGGAGSVFDALRANAGASRFAFTRSELAAPFTWASPVLSAGAFATVLALFVAHVGLGFSVASIAAQVSVLALGVAAVVHLHNSLQPHAALPQLSLPLDRASVSQLVVLAADRLNLGIERANAILSWEHPLASARALAYAWLAARFAWLAAPGYLFTGASCTRGRARVGGAAVWVAGARAPPPPPPMLPACMRLSALHLSLSPRHPPLPRAAQARCWRSLRCPPTCWRSAAWTRCWESACCPSRRRSRSRCVRSRW